MKLQTNVDLSQANTLHLQSRAEHWFELREQSELLDLINNPEVRKLKWHLLGGGSNLVLPSIIEGLVIHVANQGRALIKEDATHWYVKSAAGENWHEFVQYTLAHGYWGLENLSLIPGTVGAAPIQNIGAYGVEVKDTLWEVTCLDLLTGTPKIFTNSECLFAYRDSYFKNEGAGKYLIWDVTFRLPKQNQLHTEYGEIKKELERRAVEVNPRTISEAIIHIRQTKLPDPKIIGNAGSFFKNPIVSKEQRDDLAAKHADLVSYPYGNHEYKLAAGWLIDRSGWKGRKLGPVGMYEKQALVLINHGNANSDDVWNLANQVAKDVKEKFGVTIEPEPIRW